jgi:bifunctional oligoribonuclease and PAP phosphatase NrnA
VRVGEGVGLAGAGGGRLGMSDRMRRVNETVRAVVADAVAELQDPRLGIVTVTGVSVSPDLHDARVFVSVFGGKKKRAASLSALESARGVVQARLARELQMKRTPHVAFEYDPSVEHGVRMTKLIDELAPETPLMTPETTATLTDFDAVVDALRSHDRFLVVTHENPDGDALGSMLGATLGLRELGKDVVMHLAGETPFPAEYGFMRLGEVLREAPADVAERVLLALDCANERRLGPDPSILGRAALVVDVDHHHDNSRFGSVNLVVADASSTAEIVRDLLAALDAPLTPEIAEALYIGVVTDTGRFQYSNTTAKALRLAADLVEAGADVHGIFRNVYETVQFAKLKLLARALEHARVYEGGRLVISYLQRSDFADAGAEEPFSEGIIDFLRASEGSELVALIREPPTAGGPSHRISLRSSSDALDVSAIARKSDGGGHVQAAGFSSELPLEEIVEFIRREFVAAAGSEG